MTKKFIILKSVILSTAIFCSFNTFVQAITLTITTGMAPKEKLETLLKFEFMNQNDATLIINDPKLPERRKDIPSLGSLIDKTYSLIFNHAE